MSTIEDLETENPNLKYNYETIQYFFTALIISCCSVLLIPSMSKYPNPLLFCYFFIMISVLALFLNEYFSYNDKKQETLLYFGIPSLLFIVFSVGGAFLMISNYKTQINDGNVTKYYYTFKFVTIWLILIECYLFYHLFNMIKTGKNPKTIMVLIIIFCILSFFTIWSNIIGLKYFTADG
jgi:hypothetical protein